MVRRQADRGEDRFTCWAPLFDHRPGRYIYDLATELPSPHAPASVQVERLLWLFENADRFATHPPANVGQAVWAIASDRIRCMADEAVDGGLRERAWLAVHGLFAGLLDRVCAPVLSEGASTAEDSAALWANSAAYMFWDICPVVPKPTEPRFAGQDAAILAAMARTLELRNIACQEAALHGSATGATRTLIASR